VRRLVAFACHELVLTGTARVGEWAGAGQDVLVHFTNDGYRQAVRDAERPRALTGS
jgi:hypothetical protein